jgi:hypothetical protein
MATHVGTCFCGAVEVTVSGEPVAAGYCHCASCRGWSAAPVTAFSLWKPESVRVTRGADHVATYRKTAHSDRKFCADCGGHLMTDHPPWSLIDVYPATIPGYRHQPDVHVNYAESVLRMKDGLPKLKDLPREMGGSGEILPE